MNGLKAQVAPISPSQNSCSLEFFLKWTLPFLTRYNVKIAAKKELKIRGNSQERLKHSLFLEDLPVKIAAVFNARYPWWQVPHESADAAESRVQVLPEGVACSFPLIMDLSPESQCCGSPWHCDQIEGI